MPLNAVFTAKGLQPWSEPKIEIVDAHGEMIKSCPSYGLSVCFLNNNELHRKKTYIIGVSCENECIVKFNSFYEDEYYMSLNEEQYLIFDEAGFSN